MAITAPPPTAAAGLRPFDPRRLPFYYGWLVLVAGTIGTVASIPGQTAGVSVFTDHLSTATGLSRLQLSLAYLVGTGASGVALPRAGRWIDRLGPRATALAATLGLAATITALSFVTAMSTAVGLVVMTIGFGFLRFSGQGLLTLSSRTMVSQWFERRRGLVSSLSNAVVSFAFSLTPALLYALVEASDFRWAWRQLAIVLVVVVGAVIVVFFRDSPESCGLEIDGGAAVGAAPVADGTPGSTATDATRDATRDEAVRDLRFWLFTIPVAALAATTTALTFHIVDYGREVGMAEADVIRIFVPIAVVSIPVTIVSGWLVDSVPPIVVATAMSLTQIVMYLTVPLVDQPGWQWVAIMAWGASQGGFVALTSAAIPRVFGRTHLGAISGIQMSAVVIGSALGPAFFSVIKTTTGAYANALVALVILPLSALVLAVLSVRRYGFVRS